MGMGTVAGDEAWKGKGPLFPQLLERSSKPPRERNADIGRQVEVGRI